MTTAPYPVICPVCGRQVRAHYNRYRRHTTNTGAECFMSMQRVPTMGHRPTDLIARAHTVTDLALQIRDQDPAMVWNYLTAMPGDFVQELLMFALAAIPVEGKTVEELWDWVCDLPDALAVSA